MSRPKLFIGSSKASIKVARLVAKRLKTDKVADAIVWDKGIFSLSRGTLERLLDILSDYDFAVLIWAQDDITKSKGDSKPSPRDNVIFEAGLFMGAFGRERVFIVHDQSVELKIPSDIAGITLASYDGSRIKRDGAEGAVRVACRLISKEIQKPRFPNLVGKWTSRYVLSEEPGHADVTEIVEIKAERDGVSIASKVNPEADYYVAHGRIVHENQIIGDWRSTRGSGDGKGLFLLTMNSQVNVMYGYDTDTDESNAVVFKTWVLAKNDGSDQAKLHDRLRWAEKQLSDKTLGPAPPGA
jgi:Predicted nucleotide-binding protein containing TIR-like domain